MPKPSPEASAHSARLKAYINADMEAHGGWLDFAHFMDLVLYAPGLGYYSGGARKFGAGGDFVTAPEISPLFSQCLARQCAETLRCLDGGSILELGAGSGAMAVDLLHELEALGALPERYMILEVSGDLRERQQLRLAAAVPDIYTRIEWLDKLPAYPFQGVILGNEVLDALPVQRFRAGLHGIEALGVERVDGKFVWRARPADTALAETVHALERGLQARFTVGYESEVCLRLAPQLRALATPLERGIMFFVDYGLPRRAYYHPERTMGTLLCHYQHRVHPDPFRLVGLQDITAYVDFSAVAEAGVAAGLDVAGYTTQAHFLLAAGLVQLVNDHGDDTATRFERARQAKLLMLPSEMGERFKVIGLSKNIKTKPCGFAMRDLAHTL